MWHSVTAAAVALVQQHLFVGGLGGIIAVIAGGIASIGVIRSAKRNTARPAPSPQPAPVSRRPTPSGGFGESAPPTSPARRLHPGPISLSEPSQPQTPGQEQQEQQEQAEPLGALFDPDLFSASSEPDVAQESALPEARLVWAPVLRPISSLASEWRSQAAPLPEHTHAPIWNTAPFVFPVVASQMDDVGGLGSLSFDPPIWRAGYLSERLRPATAPLEASEAPHTTSTPIWPSWLRAPERAEHIGGAGTARLPDAPTDQDATNAPIWPSYLRPE